MSRREFFKPTFGKIVVFIILIVIAPVVGWQNSLCKPCLQPLAECPPCGAYQLKFFGTPTLFFSIFTGEDVFCCPKFTPMFVPLTIVVILILSYIFSCSLVYSFKKIVS